LKGLGGLLVSGTIVAGMSKLVGLASDAAETQNVLSESFGVNQGAVEEWAQTVAAEVGRSEFALREMAGTIGAVLNPLMEGNADVAADMSTGISQLAVDLGSFFNTTDDEALAALRSGLVGQSEPLLKFGIVANEASLAAFALEQGIRGSVKSMSVAEKTALRYQFIMAKSANAQGDAARTADGFANASKALQSGLRDLGTRIGLVLLPAVSKVTAFMAKLIRSFTAAAANSKVFEAGLVVLGAIAVVAAAKMLIAFAPLILSFLQIAAVVALAVLVVDDLITLFTGGESVIGDFIDAIFGPGSAAEAVDLLKEAWEGLVFVYTEQIVPALDAFGAATFDAVTAAGEAWDAFMDQVAEVGTFISDTFTAAWQTVQNGFTTASKAVQDGLGILFDAIRPVANFLGIDIPAAGSRGRQEGNAEKARRDKANSDAGRAANQAEADAIPRGNTRGSGVPATAPPGRRSVRAQVRARDSANSVNQTANVTVNVPAGTSRQAATETAAAVRRVMREENRKTMAAVKQQGGGV